MTKQENDKSQLYPMVFGKLDENIIKIEKSFDVSIVNRNGNISIVGENSEKAQRVIRKLLDYAEKGLDISEQTVNYVIDSFKDGTIDKIDVSADTVCLTASNKPIKAKTVGQKRYVEQIKNNTIVFGVGPAGTGKTYLAMAAAVAAFRRNDITRIVLTRPAIEAGEKLGFLPGDLQQKVDPYLRPLYDALFEIMGQESFHKNLEKGLIEVAPLAYMRGRTLDNSFIVLDEAQNTTPEQMKMFLTRIGFGSRVIVTGDITQIDLPNNSKSGLKDALQILADVEDIGISMLTSKDIVRHPLVQKIIKAYEKRDATQVYKDKKRVRTGIKIIKK